MASEIIRELKRKYRLSKAVNLLLAGIVGFFLAEKVTEMVIYEHKN